MYIIIFNFRIILLNLPLTMSQNGDFLLPLHVYAVLFLLFIAILSNTASLDD